MHQHFIPISSNSNLTTPNPPPISPHCKRLLQPSSFHEAIALKAGKEAVVLSFVFNALPLFLLHIETVEFEEGHVAWCLSASRADPRGDGVEVCEVWCRGEVEVGGCLSENGRW